MAICPKCPGKLEPVKVENVGLDYCDSCEGLWFDAGELKKALSRDSFHIDVPDLDDEKFDGSEITGPIEELLKSKPARCPICDGHPELERKKVARSGIELFTDNCSQCGGVWLDGGEINLLRNKFYRTISKKNDFIKKIVSVFYH